MIEEGVILAGLIGLIVGFVIGFLVGCVATAPHGEGS